MSPSSDPTSVERVLFVHDLSGFTRAAQESTDVEVATFLDAYYRVCAEVIGAGGGRIVKLMGDACLAVFPPERALDAIAAASRLCESVPRLAADHRFRVGPGSASIHLATVIEAHLGGFATLDVVGQGVNHTFVQARGRGPGIHVSEPLYRKLPNERRGAWLKHKPPAVYSHR